MARLRPSKLLLLAIFLVVAGCSTHTKKLSAFSSDGCSLFPDASLISKNDWCSCCLKHDLAYWRGGTSDDRERADAQLRDCVKAVTGNSALAEAMHRGVRVGGSPYFPTWFRWGYGWNHIRAYSPLTLAENRAADELQQRYLDSKPQPLHCE